MALQANLSNVAVVLTAVLGSGSVDMPAMHSLIIHGTRAFRPANVRCHKVEFYAMQCGIA